MKVIKIYSCADCPCYAVETHDFFPPYPRVERKCVTVDKTKMLKNFPEIPEWCPLEDLG